MRKFLKALLWTVGILAVLTAVARLTAIRWWRVPANDPVLEASITPTLFGGDLVLLWRATSPKFGDLVMCPEPGAPERVVIGRIVGEAGDAVKLKGGVVWINDKPAETETACSESQFINIDPDTGNEVEQTCWIEAIGGVSHKRGNVLEVGGKAKMATERTVQDGKVFLLSDNREFPYDSETSARSTARRARRCSFSGSSAARASSTSSADSPTSREPRSRLRAAARGSRCPAGRRRRARSSRCGRRSPGLAAPRGSRSREVRSRP